MEYHFRSTSAPIYQNLVENVTALCANRSTIRPADPIESPVSSMQAAVTPRTGFGQLPITGGIRSIGNSKRGREGVARESGDEDSGEERQRSQGAVSDTDSDEVFEEARHQQKPTQAKPRAKSTPRFSDCLTCGESISVRATTNHAEVL